MWRTEHTKMHNSTSTWWITKTRSLRGHNFVIARPASLGIRWLLMVSLDTGHNPTLTSSIIAFNMLSEQNWCQRSCIDYTGKMLEAVSDVGESFDLYMTSHILSSFAFIWYPVPSPSCLVCWSWHSGTHRTCDCTYLTTWWCVFWSLMV